MLSCATRFSARSAIFARAALLARPTPIPRGALPQLWSRDYSKKRRPTRPTIPPEPSNPSRSTPPSRDPVANTGAPAAESKEPAPKNEEAPEPPADTTPEKEIPLDQLPDLTQGIPSTLEYETAARNPNALATTEQTDRPKGSLPKSAYVLSSEKRRQKFANRMYLTFAVTSLIGTIYLGREWETEAEVKRYPDAPNGWSFGAWWARVKTRSTDWVTYYRDPAFEKLLPDPDPSFERPYTLVLSLEDLLIKSEWTRDHGWRIAKRPGVDYFIRYLSQYYELVLFTSVPFAIGEPAVRKLDPFRFIMWPLFREATKYQDGEFVKDLSYLNRDLSKVIIIDTNSKHVSAQPENAIVLPKWDGRPQDQELVGLIPFLEYIHTMQFPDVRRVLKSFEGKHIPTEFARREAIARAQFNKELAQNRKSTAHGASGFGFLGGLLGLKPSNMNMMQMPKGEENPQEAFAKGKMLQDIAREQGQRNYEMMEAQIRENGEKWLKEEQEAMEKMQKEAMSSMQQSFLGMFTLGGGQTPKKD